MRIHDLKAPRGATKNRKRVGRGESSGWGKTSGTGHGGAKSRSGTGKPKLGFEGGQTPMYRRMPKRGFTNIFAKKWAEINLDILVNHFAEGDTVDFASCRAADLVTRGTDGIRILGRGDLTYKLHLTVNHVTASARKKIEAAGGTVVTL